MNILYIHIYWQSYIQFQKIYVTSPTSTNSNGLLTSEVASLSCHSISAVAIDKFSPTKRECTTISFTTLYPFHSRRSLKKLILIMLSWFNYFEKRQNTRSSVQILYLNCFKSEVITYKRKIIITSSLCLLWIFVNSSQ